MEIKMSKRIDFFGKLGYGIDIINNKPLQSIVDFTFEKKQSFKFQNEVLLPDQFIYDPSPVMSMQESTYTGVMKTAKEYQIALSRSVGLSGIVDGIEFKADSSVANEMFHQQSHTTVQQHINYIADYLILQINNIQIANALLPAVKTAVSQCAEDETKIKHFFQTYGTHVITSANIGGQIHIHTDLSLDYESSMNMMKNGVDISAEAKLEDGAYANGSLKFSQRSKSDNSDFHKSSSTSVLLIGGDVTAKDANDWRKSLNNCEIPTQDLEQTKLRSVQNHNYAVHLQDDGSHYLGLTNLKYTPIYEVLGLDAKQQKAFEKAMKSYLGGVNPFDNTPKRYLPDVPESTALKVDEETTFDMRGWMATYVTYAGLEGLPGSFASVKCRSDAEPGGWTEKKVYAGETVELREKTAYMSGKMTVKFISCTGDDSATVYARNKLVSW